MPTHSLFGLAVILSAQVALEAADDGLGKLSEKYESGGRGPAMVSTGKGDPGKE